MVVELYTDGACRGNPGPGGWGVILRYNGQEKLLSGGEKYTTNNRMELMAAIMGLKTLTKPSEVVIYTDSEYVKNGITIWLKNWQKKHWRTANGQAVKNQDLWQELELQVARHKIVNWQWIKGHSGHIENERADGLARSAIDTIV